MSMILQQGRESPALSATRESRQAAQRQAPPPQSATQALLPDAALHGLACACRRTRRTCTACAGCSNSSVPVGASYAVPATDAAYDASEPEVRSRSGGGGIYSALSGSHSDASLANANACATRITGAAFALAVSAGSRRILWTGTTLASTSNEFLSSSTHGTATLASASLAP